MTRADFFKSILGAIGLAMLPKHSEPVRKWRQVLPVQEGLEYRPAPIYRLDTGEPINWPAEMVAQHQETIRRLTENLRSLSPFGQ